MNVNDFKKLAALSLAATLFIVETAWTASAVHDLHLDAKDGRIIQRHEASREKSSGLTVFHIQDVHESREGQEKIKAIIETLVAGKDISLVGVEGAVGGFPEYDRFRQMPDRGAREELAQVYLEKGFLSGAEQAAITSDYDMALVGVEDADVFKKSFKLFSRLREKQEDFRSRGGKLEKTLKTLKSKVYGPSLSEFDRLYDDFSAGRVGLITWLHALQELRGLVGEKAESFKNMDIVKQMLTLEATAPENKRDKMRSEKKLRALRESVAFHKLNREMNMLRREIADTLAETEDEREALALTHAGDVIRAMLTLKADRVTLHDFFEHRNDYRISRLVTRLDVLAKKYDVWFPGTHIPTDALDRDLEEAARFYELAEERDEILAARLISQMREEGKQTAILVAGGFHTEGLTEVLEKEGADYAVLTPQLDHVDRYNTPATDRMTGKLFSINPSLTSYFVALARARDHIAQE